MGGLRGRLLGVPRPPEESGLGAKGPDRPDAAEHGS
jgi:hypothetical protein